MNNNLQSCLVYAARYAHTHDTGAALQVVNEILKHWDSLSTNTKEQLKREAKNETLFNKEDWKRIIDKPIEKVETIYKTLKQYEDDPWAWKMKYCKHKGLAPANGYHWYEATIAYEKIKLDSSELESDGEIK